MKFFLNTISLLTLVFLMSCSPKIVGDGEGVVASIQRGPCFGKCPVYTMQVYKDGKVMYQGERFTTKMGTYTKTLGSKELKELNKLFASADFFNLQEEYPTEIPDLAKVTLYYSNGKESKKVGGKENRPPAVMQLQYAMEKIAESPDWTLVKAAPGEGGNTDERNGEAKEEIIHSEIIIEPKPGTLARFLQDWDSKSVYLTDRITEDGRLWLIKYSTKTYTPEAMLEMIKADDRIISAQFNKKLQTRSE